MPIRPSERARYPKDWKAISAKIRERAGGQCECLGECGNRHAYHGASRCPEFHGLPAAEFKGKVVFTTAHLNHTPEDNRPENLKAMCQRCHLRYDLPHHQKNARATREAKKGPLLPGLDAPAPCAVKPHHIPSEKGYPSNGTNPNHQAGVRNLVEPLPLRDGAQQALRRRRLHEPAHGLRDAVHGRRP